MCHEKKIYKENKVCVRRSVILSSKDWLGSWKGGGRPLPCSGYMKDDNDDDLKLKICLIVWPGIGVNT